MRPSLVLLVLLAPLAATCAGAQSPASATPATETCIAGARKLTQNNSITNQDSHRIDWSAPGCEVRITFHGDLRFTDDFRAIAGVARGTSVRVIESGPVDRKLEIRDGDGGTLRFDYEIDGREQPFDATASAWLESVVTQLFRRSGYGAQERAQWILRQSGPDGVFAEMEKMDDDYPRHVYSLALLKHTGADAAVRARVLESAVTWSSDYYKSNLLEALTGRASDARVVRAAWNVARTLKSDHYVTTGIQRLLALGEPGAAQVDIAIEKFDGLESDYHRGEMLKSLSRHASLEGRLAPLYLRAAQRSRSDHYRSEMLAGMVGRASLSKEQLLAAIRATSAIENDHHRSRALVSIARKHELTGEALEAYLASTDAIRSTHYYGETMRAVKRSGQNGLTSF